MQAPWLPPSMPETEGRLSWPCLYLHILSKLPCLPLFTQHSSRLPGCCLSQQYCRAGASHCLSCLVLLRACTLTARCSAGNTSTRLTPSPGFACRKRTGCPKYSQPSRVLSERGAAARVTRYAISAQHPFQAAAQTTCLRTGSLAVCKLQCSLP